MFIIGINIYYNPKLILGVNVATRAQFPPVTPYTSTMFVDGTPAETRITGRVIMYQPPSSPNVFVVVSTTGLTAGTAYNLRLYNSGDTTNQCANVGPSGAFRVSDQFNHILLLAEMN